MTPLISVVIPTYNRARDLKRALDSVRAQSFADWEAVVVDNNSTDDTDAVVSGLGDPRIALLKIHNDGIIAASRNLGIQRARGEYVAFLDSDDWWAPRKLEASARALTSGADVVYHDLLTVKQAGRASFWRRARTRQLRSPVFDDLIMNGTALTTSSVVMRRTVLQAINGFSEERAMVAMEDYDAWIRASRITERFVRLSEPLGYYWEGGGNMSGPRRLLGLLDLFEARYGAPYQSSRAGADAYWLNYDRGRSLFKLGDLNGARESLRRVQLRRVPPIVAAKTIWTLIEIRFRNGTNVDT